MSKPVNRGPPSYALSKELRDDLAKHEEIFLKSFKVTFLGDEAGIGLMESIQSSHFSIQILINDSRWSDCPTSRFGSRYLPDLEKCIGQAHTWIRENCDGWRLRAPSNLDELRSWLDMRSARGEKESCNVDFLNAMEALTQAATHSGINTDLVIEAVQAAARPWAQICLPGHGWTLDDDVRSMSGETFESIFSSAIPGSETEHGGKYRQSLVFFVDTLFKRVDVEVLESVVTEALDSFEKNKPVMTKSRLR